MKLLSYLLPLLYAILVVCADEGLGKFRLTQNPFEHPTAELFPAEQFPDALFFETKFQGFKPSEKTAFLCFGKRGSGKTTLRNHIQGLLSEGTKNISSAVGGKGNSASGTSSTEPFLVSLTDPRALNEYLMAFAENWALKNGKEMTDEDFANEWETGDLADVIISEGISKLTHQLLQMAATSSSTLKRLRTNPQLCARLELMASIYGKNNHETFSLLRQLKCPSASNTFVGVSATRDSWVSVVAEVVIGNYFALPLTGTAIAYGLAASHVLPISASIALSAGSILAGGGLGKLHSIWKAKKENENIQSVFRTLRLRVLRHGDDNRAKNIRGSLIKHTGQPSHEVLFSIIGSTPIKRLESFSELIKFVFVSKQGIFVLGDSFDECERLLPEAHHVALQRFASQVCQNELLSLSTSSTHPCGMGFFFSDTRQVLGLNTKDAVQRGRLDRYIVEDLAWSPEELFELAKRRFKAFQAHPDDGTVIPGFEELFCDGKQNAIRTKFAELHTPREMITAMHELLKTYSRNGCLSATDIEYVANKVRERSLS